jgi:hypothetical protein
MRYAMYVSSCCMRYAMYAICYDALALALPLPENCKSGKAQTQSANAKRKAQSVTTRSRAAAERGRRALRQGAAPEDRGQRNSRNSERTPLLRASKRASMNSIHLQPAIRCFLEWIRQVQKTRHRRLAHITSQIPAKLYADAQKREKSWDAATGLLSAH